MNKLIKFFIFNRKKTISISLLTMFLTSILVPLFVFSGTAYAADPTPEQISKKSLDQLVGMKLLEKKVIAAPGFFTKEYATYVGSCDMVKDYAEAKVSDIKKGQNKPNMTDSFDESQNGGAKGTKAIADMLGAGANGIISSDSNSQKGVMNLNCGQFNYLTWLNTLSKPVNITDSEPVMHIAYNFQIAALGIGVLLIAVFGLYYALGNQTTDPIRFLIRGFFVLWFVYYLPYFAQDILNINNMTTYWILTDNVPGLSFTAVASGALAGLAANTTAIMAIASDVLTGAALGPELLFIGVLILILFGCFLISTIVKMYFWWIARLLMIMFLVCLGPLFMIMMILPQTANYGQRWIQYFIGEVFTQTSIAIGLYFAASILSDLNTINKDMDFGFIGDMFMMYGVFLLLNKIPNLSKQLIGSDIGMVGWEDAKHVGKAVGNFAKTALGAMSGAGFEKMREKSLQDRAEQLKNWENQEGDLRAHNRQDEANEIKADIDKLKNKIDHQTQVGQLAGRWAGGLTGGYKAMISSADQARARAEAKAEAKVNGWKAEAEEMSYQRKLETDAANARAEVEDDFNKKAIAIEGRHSTAIARADNEQEMARRAYERKHGTDEGFDTSKFDAMRAEADVEYKRDTNALNAQRNDPAAVRRAVAKKSEEARAHAEQMAAKMLGNQFRNEAEKTIAISRKADELQAKARKVLADEAMEKGEKLSQDTGEFAEQIMQRAAELATETGVSQGQAAEYLAKNYQLQSLNQQLNNRRKPITDPEQRKALEMQKAGLENDLKTIETNSPGVQKNGKALDLAQNNYNKSFDNAVNQVASNYGLEKQQASNLLANQMQLNDINQTHGELLAKNPNMLSDSERGQRAEIQKTKDSLERTIGNIAKNNPMLNDEFKNIQSGEKAYQQATNNYNAAFDSRVNQIATQGGISASQASAALNDQLQLNELNQTHAQLLNADINSLSPDQQKQRAQIESNISSLQNGVKSIVGNNSGLATEIMASSVQLESARNEMKQSEQNYNIVKSGGSLDNFATFKQASDNYQTAFDAKVNNIASSGGINVEQASTALNNQLQINGLNNAHAQLLGADVKTLTPEQRSNRTQIESKITGLKDGISTIVGNNSGLQSVINDSGIQLNSVRAEMEAASQNYEKAKSSSFSSQIEQLNVPRMDVQAAQQNFEAAQANSIGAKATAHVSALKNSYSDMNSTKGRYNDLISFSDGTSASHIMEKAAMSSVVSAYGGPLSFVQEIQTNGADSFGKLLGAVGVSEAPEIVQSINNSGIDFDKEIQQIVSSPNGKTKSQVIYEVGTKITENMGNISPEAKSVVSETMSRGVWESAKSQIGATVKLDTAFGNRGAIETISYLDTQEITVDVVTNMLDEAGIDEAPEIAKVMNSTAPEIKRTFNSALSNSNNSPDNTRNRFKDLLKGIKNTDVSDALVESLMKEIEKTISTPKPPNGNGFDNDTFKFNQ